MQGFLRFSKLLFLKMRFIHLIFIFHHLYLSYFQKELEAVIQFGVQSMWPICVIDIDRSVVCISASINRHRHLRAKQEEISLQQIQGEHSRGFVPKL